MTTLLAPVRLTPSPPTLVVNRNRNLRECEKHEVSGSSSNNTRVRYQES
jgi:hypothetical protein